MNAKDWFDAGDKISDAVQEAVLNNDFGSLSKSIEDIVKQTMHTTDTHAQYRAQENAYEAAKKKAGIKQDSNISKRDIKDIASMFFGYGTALVSGVAFLVMTVLAAVSSYRSGCMAGTSRRKRPCEKQASETVYAHYRGPGCYHGA